MSAAYTLMTALPFVVRNTFVDVYEDCSPESGASQRSSSAPPLRGKRSEKEEQKVPVVFPSGASVSSKDQQQEEDRSTEAGLSDDVLSVSSWEAGKELCLASLIAPPGAPSRKVLNTRARAWIPATLPAQPDYPAHVAAHFAEVVQSAQGELVGRHLRASFSRSPEGWRLELQLGAGSPEKKLALELAQEALLSAARMSQCTYVLGYAAAPFTPKSNGCGFQAQLAVVSSEEDACWDLLAAGHCRRRCSCRWQHPEWQAAIDVSAAHEY
mmetsp:Transcript_59717/g.129357  ORF Transcript_59717/g.129357 Transcript_59717/m.129357 type:complete len:269 (+) Transcript_59717:119-925(+)